MIFNATYSFFCKYYQQYLTLLTAALFLVSIETQSNAPDDANLSRAHTLTLKQQDSFSISKRYSGRIRAQQHTDLGFEFAGKIQILYKHIGDEVEQGEIIAQLDTQLLETTQQQLQAKLAETQANLSLSKSSLKRQISLQSGGYASEQRLDELKAQTKVYQAAIKSIQASILANKIRIEKSSLIAPFPARVTQRFLDAGAVTAAGNPVVRLQQKGNKAFYVGIPARMVQAVKSHPLKVQVQDEMLDAGILSLGSELDINTKTLMLRVSLSNSDHLYPGSMGYLLVDEDIKTSGYKIPVSAVAEGEKGLWVVYALGQEVDGTGIVEPRSIDIIHSDKAFLYITGAIKPGEKLIADGLHRFIKGQKVRISSHQDSVDI